MSGKKFLFVLGWMILGVLNPSVALATASSSSGTVYFDLAALSSAFQSQTTSFSGWQYLSSVSADFDLLSDSKSQPVADLQADVGSAMALTHTASVFVATDLGGKSIGYQEVNATMQLEAGQYFSFAVPYTMVMHKSLLSEQVDLGAGFIIDSATSAYSIYRTTSTLDWKVLLGTGSESGVLELEMYNAGPTAMTYSIKGWLGATGMSEESVVPEPSTYLMLLLGLYIVGVATRGRNDRSGRL